MERGVGSDTCYTLDHFLRWIFHFLVNAILTRLILYHLPILLSQYPSSSVRSLHIAHYRSFLKTHLVLIRIVLPCTWLLPFVITPLLNFCLTPANILTCGLFMIPWLLCIQVYCIAVLPYFFSTNYNFCYQWYCCSLFTPLQYLLVLNIYTIWSVVCFLCTYFYSIGYFVSEYVIHILVHLSHTGTDPDCWLWWTILTLQSPPYCPQHIFILRLGMSLLYPINCSIFVFCLLMYIP